MDHDHFMGMALELAGRGRGRVAPNPLVGAVVVREGRVAGRGWHARCGGPHAETVALDEAGPDARGADLYVTLEPCNHCGRTGKCTAAIIDAGIARVVYAIDDPNPSVTGGGAACLRTNGIAVTAGICADAAARQNRFFIKSVTRRLPFVILKWAMSLDGASATAAGASRWISGEPARRKVHALRAEVAGVLVGASTVAADDPLLTQRSGAPDVQPVRIVIDPSLRTGAGAQVVRSIAQGPVLFIAADDADPARRAALESAGATCLAVPRNGSRLDLAAACTELNRRGINSLLVEGGGITAGAFVDARLADEVVVFCAPCLIGGAAVRPLAGAGITAMDRRIDLRMMEYERVGDDLCIRGRIAYPGA
ncbi:MAG: bifunctional diaminohydroxyphosphoribosylaminopyrimidine deaminase/5-amino-6-(5-phosphoribosylamino)uracil reductase RibD [Planctomycetota bacterium]